MDEIGMILTKYNYVSTPHVLEPIDQLTFEAYTSRYTDGGRMNLYMGVSPKVLYRISGPGLKHTKTNPDHEFNVEHHRNFTDAELYLINCCAFHGCSKSKRPQVCHDHGEWAQNKRDRLNPHHITAQSKFWLRMNHYSRSLEKFQLKQATWKTANQESNSYEYKEFFSRSFGWEYDPVALLYSCTVRHEINRAKLEYIARKKQPMYSTPNPLLWHFDIATPPSMHHFQRQGDNWYRNPEFGLTIAHPNKRWDRVTGAGGDESGLTINHTKASYNPTLVESLYAASTDTQLLFQDHYT